MQTFIEESEQKVTELQVRFNKLPDIFNRYDNAQTELELSDDIDQTADRELFETQYYQEEASFCELLRPVIDSIPISEHPSPPSSQSGRSNATLAHTLDFQILHYLHSLVRRVIGYHIEIHLKP
jgi:hypothetical protein